ncbi:MAG TPA: hypothetical protein VFX30_06295 [bacterium]|nr:hypothetical protein [bacterium]
MKFKYAFLAASLFAAIAVSGCGQSLATIDASGQNLSSSDVVPSGTSTEVAGTDTVITPDNTTTTPPNPTPPPPPPPAQDPTDPNDPSDPSTPPLNVCSPTNPPPCIIVDPAPPTPPVRGTLAESVRDVAVAELSTPVIEDATEIENIRIDVMVPDFSRTGGDPVAIAFCRTPDFNDVQCVRLSLGQLEAGKMSSFTMKESGFTIPVAKPLSRIDGVTGADLAYFRIYALGYHQDSRDTLFVGGVSVSALAKGTDTYATVYRNPCVNRRVFNVQGDDTHRDSVYASDHSRKNDQAVCVYSKTADKQDAGTDDRVTIEIPLSGHLENTSWGWIKMNHNQKGGDMPIRYDEAKGLLSADLQYDTTSYDDFRDSGATSYGFTVFDSGSLLTDTFNLRINDDDALEITEFDVYLIRPGSDEFLKKGTFLVYLSNNMEQAPTLSTDGDEGVDVWVSNLHTDLIESTTYRGISDQFRTIEWGHGSKAFGVK